MNPQLFTSVFIHRTHGCGFAQDKGLEKAPEGSPIQNGLMVDALKKRVQEHMIFREGSDLVRFDRLAPQAIVRVCRGVYLRLDALLGRRPDLVPDWQIYEVVNLARLHAAAYRYRATGPVFSGTSALVALGASHWRRAAPLTVRRWGAADAFRRELPSVGAGDVLVPPVTVHGRPGPGLSDPPFVEKSLFGDLQAADSSTVALDLVRTQSVLEGFVNTCLLLTHRNPFTKFEPAQQMLAHEASVVAIAHDLESVRGRRGFRRLLHILERTQPGLDSPGEAALLWMVNVWWNEPDQIKTQHHLRASGKDYFVDVAIPQFGMAFEFDGASKFGSGTSDWQARSQGFLARQRDLLRAGWHVSRITFTDLMNPSRALKLVGDAVRGLPGARSQPGGPLWHPTTEPNQRA